MRVSSILAVSLSVIAVSAHGDYDDSDCSSHLPSGTLPAGTPPASTPNPQLVVEPVSSPIPSGDYYSSQVHGAGETVPPTPTPTSAGGDGYGPPAPEEVKTTPIPTPTPTSVSGDEEDVPPEDDCACTASYAYTTVTQTICPATCYEPTTPAPTHATPTPLNPDYPPASSVVPPPVSSPGYPVESPLPSGISDTSETGYPNITVTTPPAATTPVAYEGGAIANQATVVGGALAALLCVVSYLL